MMTVLKLRLATTVTVLTLATAEPTPNATSGTTNLSATVLLASLVTLRLAVYQVSRLNGVKLLREANVNFLEKAGFWEGLFWKTLQNDFF